MAANHGRLRLDHRLRAHRPVRRCPGLRSARDPAARRPVGVGRHGRAAGSRTRVRTVGQLRRHAAGADRHPVGAPRARASGLDSVSTRASSRGSWARGRTTGSAWIADRYPDAFNFTPPFSDTGVPTDGVFFMLLIALDEGRSLDAVRAGAAALVPGLHGEGRPRVDVRRPRSASIPRFDTEEQRSEFWDILLGKVRERTFDEWQGCSTPTTTCGPRSSVAGASCSTTRRSPTSGQRSRSTTRVRAGPSTRPAGADELDAGAARRADAGDRRARRRAPSNPWPARSASGVAPPPAHRPAGSRSTV